MKKFKTSIYGYRKRDVHELLNNLQDDYKDRKQVLVRKIGEIMAETDELRRKVESAKEGGRKM